MTKKKPRLCILKRFVFTYVYVCVCQETLMDFERDKYKMFKLLNRCVSCVLSFASDMHVDRSMPVSANFNMSC